jgi:Protein of unknown function (DUF2568)
MILSALKNANLALAFFLELAVLAALGYWGFHTGPNIFMKIGFGIGLPVIAIVIWALWGAPRSATRLRGFWFLLLQIIFFGSAAIALYTAQQHTLGIVFALVFVLNCTLGYVWRQK